MKKKTIINVAERIGRFMLPVLVSALLAGCALVVAYFAWGFEHYGIINAVVVFDMAAILFAALGIPVYLTGVYLKNETNDEPTIGWHVGRFLCKRR